MRLILEINTEEQKLKECIAIAWEKRFGEVILPQDMPPFKEDYVMLPVDLQNILLGSCLAELINIETDKLRSVK